MSKQVLLQGLAIGGGAPVRVESMLKIPLSDFEGCVAQCESLLSRGCEIARVALPETTLAEVLGKLVKSTKLRIMADIHFDPEIAVAAMKNGCASVRINPGNMPKTKLAEMIKIARSLGVVIRIGANGGSLNNSQMEQAGGDRAVALFNAVCEQTNLLLENGFANDIILSAKSSCLPETVRANALLAQKYNFPLHIGITEAGFGIDGIVKGAAGIAIMLAQGVGDTIRVSLTDEPENEVRSGYAILKALEIRKKGVQIISCPTCGRRRADVRRLAEEIEPLLRNLPDGTTVAVMGCEVNGPREAAHADFGVAGTPNGIAVFKHGKILGNFSLEELPEALKKIIL